MDLVEGEVTHAERAWTGRTAAVLRLAFPVTAWLFVGCVVVQFFLVGLRMFAEGPLASTLHRDFAYLYGWLTPILVLLAASPAGSLRAVRLAVALLVLFAVQTFLPLLAEVAPPLAALHAANALVVAWVALRLAQASRQPPDPIGTPRR
jgi:hypothetical protein